MRHLTFLIVLFLMSCSSPKSIHDSKFDGFHYPWDSLTSPKVFVYSRVDSPNIKSFQYQRVLIQGKDSFLIKSSLIGNMRDSSKSLITGQRVNLIETYMIQKNPKGGDFKTAKGEILENDNNDLMGKSKIKFINPFYESGIAIMESNGKLDTLLAIDYKNITYPCLIYSNKIRITTKHKYIPSVSKSFEKSINSVVAKGIGLIQYTMIDTVKGEKFIWKLDTIMNYKNYKK